MKNKKYLTANIPYFRQIISIETILSIFLIKEKNKPSKKYRNYKITS